MYRKICVTNRALAERPFLEQLACGLATIPFAIILREKDLTEEAYEELAGKVKKLCENTDTRLILHSFPDAAMHLGGTAIHMPLHRYMEMPENRGIRKGKAMVNLIYKAVSEVSGAIATAMITTIVSFLPVFAMEAQEGKMFSPLAYTKTYALASAFVLGLILQPTLSYILFSVRIDSKRIRKELNYILIAAGDLLSVLYSSIPALGLTAVGLNNLLAHRWKKPGISNYINIGIALVVATYFLAEELLPMGPQKGIIVNLLYFNFSVFISVDNTVYQG